MLPAELNASFAAVDNAKLVFSTVGPSHGRLEAILDNFRNLLGAVGANNMGEGGLNIYPSYTIATLPTVAAADNGKFAVVTDATTATNGSPPATGGGSIVVLCKVVGGAWACQ